MAPHDDQPGTEIDLVKLEREERYVREGFFEKLRRTLGLIPFAEDALAAYYCALDSKTPLWVRAVLFGALAYFILPSDVIPDLLAVVGYTDDASVLIAAMAAAAANITEPHRQKARAFFGTEAE